MALFLELEKLRDKYGFIQPFEGWSGNGILYTAESLILLDRWGELTEEHIKKFDETIRSVTIEPGLYHRFPGYDDQQGQDDYIGLSTVSLLFKTRHAKDIFEYGKNHGWVYANKPANQDQWMARFWRFPQVVAHFYWCAGHEPPLWRRIYWLLVIATTGLFGDAKGQDTWILSWLHILACPHKDKLIYRWVISIWKDRLWEYHCDMKGVFEAYFRPGHPLAYYYIE